MKRTIAAAAGALAMTGGAAFMATPAQAQPVFTGGLVNVNVTDVSVLNDVDVLRNSRILNNVLNNNNVSVGVAANIAAQVCADANVAAVIAEIRDTGGFSCESANEAGDLVISQAQ
jgi:hypothetical protein